MKVELTVEEVENLKTFLGRVDLKGTEVEAFVNIINALSKAKEV